MLLNYQIIIVNITKCVKFTPKSIPISSIIGMLFYQILFWFNQIIDKNAKLILLILPNELMLFYQILFWFTK